MSSLSRTRCESPYALLMLMLVFFRLCRRPGLKFGIVWVGVFVGVVVLGEV